MSKRYWAADAHFNHPNVCIYGKRPWLKKDDLDAEGKWVSQEAATACGERMNAGLIHEFNMRVKPEDRVVHLGDFATKGSVRGVDGIKVPYTELLDKLNGHWTLIEGNHDKQGRVKTVGHTLFGNLGPLRFVAMHKPLCDWSCSIDLRDYAFKACDISIVGHVHTAWSARKYAKSGLIEINVGVDVRRWRPMSDDELIAEYFRLKEKWRGETEELLENKEDAK